jgi:hypothetical protein
LTSLFTSQNQFRNGPEHLFHIYVILKQKNLLFIHSKAFKTLQKFKQNNNFRHFSFLVAYIWPTESDSADQKQYEYESKTLVSSFHCPKTDEEREKQELFAFSSNPVVKFWVKIGKMQ